MLDYKRLFALVHYRYVGCNGDVHGDRILCYHNVKPQDATAFAAQLDFLKASYRVMPLSEYLVSLSSRTAQRPPALAITFDDGYRDNYEVAFPLLRRAGVSAAFCVVSGIRVRSAAERAAAPKPRPGEWSPRLFMTWDELREMVADGMEVHLHSHAHANTAKLSAKELTADIKANQQAIEDHLGVKALAYAIPFGRLQDCHPALPSLLESQGIRYALLATHGINDGSTPAYRLHRDTVEASYSVAYLRAILHGCFDAIARPHWWSGVRCGL